MAYAFGVELSERHDFGSKMDGSMEDGKTQRD
jgi:hypothetical protein